MRTSTGRPNWNVIFPAISLAIVLIGALLGAAIRVSAIEQTARSHETRIVTLEKDEIPLHEQVSEIRTDVRWIRAYIERGGTE